MAACFNAFVSLQVTTIKFDNGVSNVEAETDQ